MKKLALSIMFVDDEINVLHGMRNSYDWDTLGFTLVGEAQDADTALALARRTMPDLVITDICMDGKDGLTLISELKELNPSMEVIILSGYPNFSFAKSAIEKGAFAYLLKPLKNAEFFDTLEKVRAKILATRRKTSTLFLSHLLSFPLPTAENIAALEKEYGLKLPEICFFVATIRLEPADSSSGDDAYKGLLSFFQEKVTDLSRSFFCWKQERHSHIAALLFCSNVPIQTVLCSQLNEIRERYAQQTGTDLTIGISSLFSDIISIRDAYLEASYASLQKKQYPQDRMIVFNGHAKSLDENATSTSAFLTSAEMNQFMTGIKTLNRPLIDQMLETYFSKLNTIKSANWDMIQNALIAFAIQIISAAADQSERTELIFGKKPLPATDILSLNQLSDMQEYIRQLIEQIFNHPDLILPLSDQLSKPVRDIQTYIYLHYPLHITVDTIADELHLNKFYLMRLFKQETGYTINEFLTKHRVETACEFLKCRDCQVSEAGYNVGYQDSNYFCKVFKKQMGMLPSEYRSQR